MPTASAVISDIVDLARNIICGSAGRVPLLSFQEQNIKEIPILPVDEIETHYYIRFSAIDSPGVLSKISGVLGDYGISIQCVHQKGRKTNGDVPVVMLTHYAKESNVKKALDEIASLDVVSDTPIQIRIEDENGQE
jgi:homoserine dehydrogenase